MTLQIRFSAKFHMQMCAVLSQSGNHSEALKHSKLAMLMCEDNICKTHVLFKKILSEYNRVKEKKSAGKKNEKILFFVENEDFILFEEKIKDCEGIFVNLINKLKFFKSNDNTTKIDKDVNNFIEIEQLKQTVRKVLSVKIIDDWTNILSIGNIMYLSALNIEDLDLDSDPKFELLRDAIIEKVKINKVNLDNNAFSFVFLHRD